MQFMTYRHIIATTCFILNATSISAQYADGSDVLDSKEIKAETEIYALYRFNHITSNVGVWGSNFDAILLHGAGAGFSVTRFFNRKSNFNLTLGADMTISTSASHQFWNKNDNYNTWYHETAEANLSTIVFRIPFSVGYNFYFPSKLITICPFTGISCNAHMFVRSKINTNNNFGSSGQLIDLLYSDSSHESFSNLLCLDGHVGLKCKIGSRYSVIVSYNKYLNPVYTGISSYGNVEVNNWSIDLKLSKRL